MNYSISKVYFSHKTTNYCTFLVQITFWVGSVILPTRTGMWFFLSWTMKINGRSTTTSFCSPKAAEKRAISTPVAAAPSVPSFVTWAKLCQVGQQQQQQQQQQSIELCMIKALHKGRVLDPAHWDWCTWNSLQLSILVEHLQVEILKFSIVQTKH